MTFSPRQLFRPLLLAGVAGGMAEIVWIALYSLDSPFSAADVAREVVSSISPSLAEATFAPTLGIGIHLALSMLLAFAFGLLVWAPLLRRVEPRFTVIACVVALIFVWTINFFVVLPRLNPAFVVMVPYMVALFSKLLFGLAAGWSLSCFNSRPALQPATIRLLRYNDTTAGG